MMVTIWFMRFSLALAVSIGPLVMPAAAQSGKPTVTKIPFLKTEVSPLNGMYLVLQDANVRQRPTTKGRRIGRRAKGERVRIIGHVKGAWLAIRDDEGKDIGFIFHSTLMPVIDGTLEMPLSGKLTAAKTKTCTYHVHFEGKSQAEGQAFEFSDYDVRWVCALERKKISFQTPMFLTEGPYRGKTKRVHQITIDILDLGDGLEDVLSTHMLWNRDGAQIVFDSVSIKRFGRKLGQPDAKAETLDQALHEAVRIAAQAWNGQLWAALLRRDKIARPN